MKIPCVTDANTQHPGRYKVHQGVLVHRGSLAAMGGAHKEAPVEEFASCMAQSLNIAATRDA